MHIVDLSQEIHPKMKLFPVYPQPSILPWSRRETAGFQSEVVFMATHTGTHLDVPYHFDSTGLKVNEVPVERLIGDAIMIDLGQLESLTRITGEMLMKALQKAGNAIRGDDIVIVKTGWSRYAGEDIYVTRYPGLTDEAAQYLLEKDIRALGVDTPNPDHPDESSFPVHNLLLSRGRLIIENLMNLDKIDQSRFRFTGVPLKIDGATGSPIRALAILD